MDPISFIRYLQKLGTITRMRSVTDNLPVAESMDAETCYMGFDIEFESMASQSDINGVFDFMRDNSHIAVTPLVAVVVQPELTGSDDKALAPDKKSQTHDKKSQEAKFIKIDISKLDQLIDLVGELVTASAAANTAAHASGAASARETADAVIDLVEQIRDNALSLRMVPIGEVFSRFPRVVRDVAKELGKQIELKIAGAETELDKSMVEKLVDPLMHCVRNAMDHGIENMEDRRAAGKIDAGTLQLNAYQESGSIVIEIIDDGRGMDTQRIRSKAIERGLISSDAELSHQDILNLIFAPGFSTAAQVTNISGRGVGMDVVKKNIEALRGEVELESQLGAGSTIRIRLPLTLAIIDGFRVQVNRSDFVIPLESIKECIDLNLVEMRRDLINLRGESLPILYLRDLFQLDGTRPHRESLVVVQFGQTRAGIVVDRLVGELQAVIKPLDDMFRHTRSISGSTILGNGDVALLLDVQQVVQSAVLSQTVH